MKHKMFLFAVLLLISTYSLSAQEDPNVMWTYKDASFSTYPAVHPNGNVLIGDGSKGDVIELNGLTGELVRRIPLPAPTSSLILSKDGSRLAASGYIIDVETGAVIKAHPRAAAVRFLHPSNTKVIYTLFNQNDTSWVVWDMDNDTYKNYQIPHLVTSIDVSNDGRFLAVASKETSLPINEQRTHFYLYDAQTMQLIRELENVLAEGRTIEFIQFSENAKFVGYGQLTGGTPKATFFSCESPYKKWEVKTEKSKPYGSHGICFINNDYVYLSYIRGAPNNHSAIYDINNDKIIYETDLYHSYFPVFNQKYNNIVINGALALDFNKILNSVSVDESNEPIKKLVTDYRNGILKISGFESISPDIKLSINDIQGNVVFYKKIQTSLGNSIMEIPVQLPSGVYILQFKDGKNYHSGKFLVVE
ncbi:MAG: T9SS type A sorting domain-containing protein [Candidatus Kapabacteria bacterium]|nr:T9SS type A sorting domain-containing protein [Candidatus Kapabacteria bacterium]